MTDHHVAGDVVAGAAVIGAYAGYLPDAAAGMACIYYACMFVSWIRKNWR